jgi:hypothetical protein
MRSLLACAALGIALSGCQTVEERRSDPQVAAAKAAARRARMPKPVAPTTIIPERFSTTLPEKLDAGPRSVPKAMLSVAKVVRPRAELREGPGPEFMLHDTLLAQGTQVLVFSRVGVWQKVLVPGSWKKGWIHRQALSEVRPSERAMRIDMSRLPTVLAVRGVDKARAFPSLSEVQVEIPRGSMFRSLKENDWGTLVWLPETNSVMWMARKDVQ